MSTPRLCFYSVVRANPTFNLFTRFRTIISYPIQYTLIEMIMYPSCLCSYLQQHFSCLTQWLNNRGTEYCRAGAIVGRCAATNVVRSTASRLTLRAGLSSTVRMALLVCKDERVCGFYTRVSRSDWALSFWEHMKIREADASHHRNLSRCTQRTWRNHTHLIHQHHALRFDF